MIMQNVHLSIGEDAMCEDENGDTGFDNDLDISSDNESSAVVSEIDESETIEEISDVSFDVDDSSGLEEVPEISEIESMPEMVADEAIEEFDIDNYSSLEEVSEYIDETNDIDTLLDIRDALTGELLEDINYTSGRKLNRKLIDRLATCEYITGEHRNLFITGATGSGKTYMACAFGMEACKQRFRTKYVRLPDLLMILRWPVMMGHTRRYRRNMRILFFSSSMNGSC